MNHETQEPVSTEVVCLFNARTHRPVTWADSPRMKNEGVIMFSDEKTAESWRDEMKSSVRKHLGKRMRQQFIARRIPCRNVVELSRMFDWKFVWSVIGGGCYAGMALSAFAPAGTGIARSRNRAKGPTAPSNDGSVRLVG